MEDQKIGELERSQTEKIIVQLKSFRGRRYMDFRLYYLADEDEWRPTQTGITIRPDMWSQFKELVDEADSVLRDAGLLE